MVIAVLARPSDVASAALVRRWHAHEARMLTSADLMQAGWVRSNHSAHEPRVVIDGELMPESAVTGVLVRAPAIEATELRAIIEEDREYCAAEMTAFLTWWLASLAGRVINRPTATSLAAPGWRLATWHLMARQCGLTSARPRWRASEHRLSQPIESKDEAGRASGQLEIVTVVSGRVIGSADQTLARGATQLAEAADAEALSVAFDVTTDPPSFCWAEPWPDVSDPAIADALLESLLARGPDDARGST